MGMGPNLSTTLYSADSGMIWSKALIDSEPEVPPLSNRLVMST